ncbi:hypothetical protein CAEBREN_15936 [Caenorhabditis brenneri]|uniref:SAP domain-containing protein n=1 Tax=Caenorhabditis brenneri TaxID=135651 RepID=G0NTC9_CAEBE|nr:hypothetical protein CAEBREN_15936 [Caenorhabditis brenneri]
MPAKSRPLVEEDVFNMTFDKLRKELKKKRLSAAGKKSDLQFRLVEFLNSQREADQQETINEDPEDEPNTEEPAGALMEVDELSTPSNRTFTIEENTEGVANQSNLPKRGGYTPHTSKKVFVDTTQLTDREYNLAMEEGLIPGKAATLSNLEKRQLESKKRRDDIIALKRKMNIK